MSCDLEEASKQEVVEGPREKTKEELSNERVPRILEKIRGRNDIVFFNFNVKANSKNPNAVINDERYDSFFIKSLYKKILNVNVDSNDQGYKDWMSKLSSGVPRSQVEDFFRKTANNDNSKNKPTEFEDILGDEGKENRIIVVMPGSIGDCILIASIIPQIKAIYPKENLYVATNQQNLDIFLPLEEVHKVIPYSQQMDNLLWLEGNGEHKGYFKIAFLPYINTQRIFTYQHNGEDRIDFSLIEFENE